MEEGGEENMLGGDLALDTEWSTREKLAIASYVLRSGEQHWSGVGRLLRPLGEKGRPPDWFSPKSCAQQYTALLQQQDAPKRKRSSERGGDSSENVQPGSSTEETIVSRLTRERIEELKKQLRAERTEYRKLKREIELVESGAQDDDLDALLRELENDGEESETVSDEKIKDYVTSKDEEQSVADEVKTELERLQNSGIFQESILVAKKADTEHVSASISEFHTGEAVGECKEEAEDADDDGSQIVKEFTDLMNSDEHILAKDSKDEANVEQLSNVQEVVTNEELQPDQDFVNPEYELAENTDVGGDTQRLTEPSEIIAEQQVTKLDSLQNKPNSGAISISKHDQQGREAKTLNDDSLISEITEEGDSTFNYSVDDSTLNSMSLPGTPRPGSLMYDSFPSSPALSHSSDMDPDSTASWKAWRKSIMILWKQVASHRYASLFLQPVTDDIAPNYSTTVYRNMDLSVLKKNVESGVVRTTKEFHRDLMLMFQNAIMYNNREHDVYKMTMEMQKDVMDQVAQFMSTQMIAETAQPTTNKSLRRSTMRRAVLANEKSGEFRTRRSAPIESESKFTH